LVNAVLESEISAENGNNLWPKLNDVASDSVLFAAGADRVIHPGQKHFVSKLDYNEIFDPRLRDWGVSNLKDGEALTLQFQYGCEDCPMDTAQITLTKEQFLTQ